jgi:hypothetical protein
VLGDRASQPVREIFMYRVKGQERHDRSVKVLDILGLGLLSAPRVGSSLFGEALRRSLDVQFRTNALNRRRCRPDAARKDLSPFLLSDDPMIASGLHSASQRGIARQQKNPAFWHGQNFSIGGSNGIGRRAWRKDVVTHPDYGLIILYSGLFS